MSIVNSHRLGERTRPSSLWDYMSPSRLNLWIRCPLAFKFRYIDGIRTPPTPNLFLGKAVHAALEYFYRQRRAGMDLPAPAVIEHLHGSWDLLVVEEDMQFSSVEEEAELKRQSCGLVAEYLQRLPASENRPTAVEVSVESPLIDPVTGESLGMPLLGILDLVLPDANGSVICDFKTSNRSNSPVEILHEVQLTAYAYLYRQATNSTEGGLEIRSLIKTKSPKVECHRYPPRTDAHMRRFFQLVRAYLDALHSGKYVYRPGLLCSMCDYHDGPCSSWEGE
jgi:putative RecB family exonuclease